VLRLVLLAAALLAAVPSPGAAPAADPWLSDAPAAPDPALDALVARAMESSPILARARAAAEGGDARLLGARAAFLPSVGAAERFTSTDNPPLAFFSILNQGSFSPSTNANEPGVVNDWATNLYARYLLFDFGRRSAALDAARADAERLRLLEAAGRRDVRFTVTAAGYREVFTKYPFFLYTWNSLVVAAGSTALGLAVGLPAAYSIARWRQQRLAVVILVARIIPGIAYLIPWYIFFRRLRMVDTYGALILTHLIVGLPIIIWVMISFFEDVPADLEDAALIDGCSYWSAFWRIALPLVKPGVVATAILSFVFSWNNFLFSVILAGRSTRTLPIAVYTMISYEEINWGTLAAAATLITLPVLLVALVAQRHIVSGLTFGAVKQ